MAAQRNELAQDTPIGAIERLAHVTGPLPMGVTVSHTGRVFVNFPKWGDKVDCTVAEVRDEGDKGASDGLESDATGALYFTRY